MNAYPKRRGEQDRRRAIHYHHVRASVTVPAPPKANLRSPRACWAPTRNRCHGPGVSRLPGTNRGLNDQLYRELNILAGYSGPMTAACCLSFSADSNDVAAYLSEPVTRTVRSRRRSRLTVQGVRPKLGAHSGITILAPPTTCCHGPRSATRSNIRPPRLKERTGPQSHRPTRVLVSRRRPAVDTAPRRARLPGPVACCRRLRQVRRYQADYTWSLPEGSALIERVQS